MSRRRSLGLKVDDRTEHMSNQALTCRRLGHKWTKRAISRRRFMELLKDGLTEDDRFCDNGCGSEWRQVWRINNGAIVENERKYPGRGEYLMPSGSGRLHRDDARVAAFAREYPAYA